MLFYIIFIHYFAIVSASWDVFSTYLGSYRSYESDETHRHQRQVENREYEKYLRTESISLCRQYERTHTSPFVVVILYKTSGRFLGMGSIIDKKTVLTASRVVVTSVHRPAKILSMASRRNAWWGNMAQVQPASEIFLSGGGLALLKLKNPFNFNRNVLPIQLAMLVPDDKIREEFDRHWLVVGIPRSSWNVPGELMPKPSIYILEIETEMEKKEDLKTCAAAYPDLSFNDTAQTCTIANGTFGWGCIGSPVVAMDLKKQIVQIGVVIRATMTEADEYHVIAKTGTFNPWIKSNSHMGFAEAPDG